MELKIEDIMFWILIALIVGIAVWKLIGSPTDTASLISLALFVAGSELMIWKKIFFMESKTTIGFIKVGHDIEKMRINIDNRFDKLENSLDKLGKKIK